MNPDLKIMRQKGFCFVFSKDNEKCSHIVDRYTEVGGTICNRYTYVLESDLIPPDVAPEKMCSRCLLFFQNKIKAACLDARRLWPPGPLPIVKKREIKKRKKEETTEKKTKTSQKIAKKPNKSTSISAPEKDKTNTNEHIKCPKCRKNLSTNRYAYLKYALWLHQNEFLSKPALCGNCFFSEYEKVKFEMKDNEIYNTKDGDNDSNIAIHTETDMNHDTEFSANIPMDYESDRESNSDNDSNIEVRSCSDRIEHFDSEKYQREKWVQNVWA